MTGSTHIASGVIVPKRPATTPAHGSPVASRARSATATKVNAGAVITSRFTAGTSPNNPCSGNDTNPSENDPVWNNNGTPSG